MKNEQRFLIRGVGIGILLTATLFFLFLTFSVPKQDVALTDPQVIERARSLGMIFITELTDHDPKESTTDIELTSEQEVKIVE